MQEENLKIVEKYLESKGYRYDATVLGVIFYGSRARGDSYTEKSDFDLLIITTGENEKRTEIQYFESIYRFECHKINLDIIIETLKKDFILSSILLYGEVVIEKEISLYDLKIEAKNIIKNWSCDKMDKIEKESYLIRIENLIREVDRQDSENSPGAKHLIHLTAEVIRKFYHKYKSLPPIRESKVYRVYTNKDYRSNNFFDIPIPEKKFINLYLKVIIEENDNAIKSLKKLWEYIKKQTSNDSEQEQTKMEEYTKKYKISFSYDEDSSDDDYFSS